MSVVKNMKGKQRYYYMMIWLLSIFYICTPVQAIDIARHTPVNDLLVNNLQKSKNYSVNKNLQFSDENLLTNPSLSIDTDNSICGQFIGGQKVECDSGFKFLMPQDWFVNAVSEDGDIHYNQNPFCRGTFDSNRDPANWAYCVTGNDGKIFFDSGLAFQGNNRTYPFIRNAESSNTTNPAFIQFIEGEVLDNDSEEDYFNIMGSAVYQNDHYSNNEFVSNFLVILEDTHGERVELEIPAGYINNFSKYDDKYNNHALYYGKNYDFYATIPEAEISNLDLENGIYFIIQSQNPNRYFYLNYIEREPEIDEKELILTKGEAIKKFNIIYDEDGISVNLRDEITEDDIYESLIAIISLADGEVTEYTDDFEDVLDINSFEILDNPKEYENMVISGRMGQKISVEFELDGALETIEIPLVVNDYGSLFFTTVADEDMDRAAGFSMGLLSEDDSYKLVGSLGNSEYVEDRIDYEDIYGLATFIVPKDDEDNDEYYNMNINVDQLKFDDILDPKNNLDFIFPREDLKTPLAILDEFNKNSIAEESLEVGDVIRVAMEDSYNRFEPNIELTYTTDDSQTEAYQFNSKEISVYESRYFNYFFLINDNDQMQPLYNNLVDVIEDDFELETIQDLEQINQCRVTYDTDDEDFRYIFVDGEDEIENKESEYICGNILDFTADEEFYQSIDYSFHLLNYEKDADGEDYIAEILVTSIFETDVDANEEVTMTFTVQRDYIQLNEDETISWLPDYDRWGSFDQTIPKKNAFMMTPLMAEPIASSDDIHLKSDQDTVVFGALHNNTLSPNEPSWIRWANVGYYNGQKIDLKLTLQSQNRVQLTEQDKLYNTITIRGSNAFSFSVTSAIGKEGMNVTYEFLDQQGNKVPVSGYWPIYDLYNDQTLSIPTREITQIYSLSRGQASSDDTNCIDCTLLSYSLEGSNIRITGQNNRSLRPEQNALFFIYNDQTAIQYRVFANEGTPLQKLDVIYSYETPYMRVAIPDVMDDPQIISEVSSKQQFTNQFIQYIPFEPKNKRDQHMNWKVMLPENSIFDVPIQKIHIFDESGIQQQDLFDITLQNQEITIKPKSLENGSLYNHYYWFKIPLTFNGTEVKEQDLDQKWLNYKSTVQLFINNQLQNQVMSGTKINMQANVDYQYKDQNGDVFHSENKHTLITHKIPKVEEQRPGYRYINSEPNDYQDKIILESKSQVQLNYKLLKQGLIVPDTLEFETISLPITRPGTRSRLNANWQLTVYGDYSQKNRPNVYVVQQQPFTSKNDHLEDDLYMIYKGNRIPLKSSQQSLEIDSIDFSCNAEECNTNWQINQGILLKYDNNLSDNENLKGEIYTSSMIFSLQNAL